MATKQPEPAAPAARPPVGVYTDHSRNTCIAFRRTPDGMWYLTIKRGWIEMVHCGDTKFIHDFPIRMPDYPIRRALTKYKTSGLRFDNETTEKVVNRLLEAL